VGFLGLSLLVGACGQRAEEPASILNDERFVAVPRDISSLLKSKPTEAAALRTGATAASSSSSVSGNSFYLAIRKSELGKRFFLTAYSKQIHPGGVNFFAASTVGTRVVSFQVQNGKLYMFDVADIYTLSDAFDPTLVLEAWPIVNDSEEFNHDRNSNKYVLVDPSAGLNQFSLWSEFFNSSPPYFHILLSYLDNFRSIKDGVTFDQIYTGEATDAVHDQSGGEPNVLRISGTLGITLRDYFEGEGYTIFRPPDGTPEFYFLSDIRQIPNSGLSEQTPVRWNIHQGMKPIRMTISSYVKTLAQDPFYGQYDIAGAIKKGIENWNQVFGFKAVEAVVGTDNVDPGDDDVNFIYVDVNPSVGFAFADWRSNPNTGETRGASIYFNTIFIDGAAAEFDSAHARAPLTTVLGAASPHPPISLGWAGMQQKPLCMMPVHPQLGEDFSSTALSLPRRGSTSSTPTGKALVEAVITHTILHEMGHVLGLRHNFKGSIVGTLAAPSSSSMDYLFDEDGVLVQTPPSYDTAAIKWLYGLSPNPPTDPFCNDDGTSFDPDCTRFDTLADPLHGWWIPLYRSIIDPFLDGSSPFIPSAYTLNSLLAYVRAGATLQTRLDAWDGAFDPVTGLAAPVGKIGSRVDAWANFLQNRVFLDPAAARTSQANSITNDPSLTVSAAIRAQILGEISAYLNNTNTVMSYTSRRNSVDILKKVQHADAYAALVQARANIAATAPASDLLAQDLLARIDAAIHPYFK